MYNKAIENATVTLAETMANIRADAVSETKSLNSVDSVENVAYNTQAGEKENGTGLQETSGRTVPGNAGEESQAGTDGTVSGSVVANVYPELAQEVSGDNGRGNNRYPGELVKTELKNRGQDPVDLRTENEPSSFYAAIGEAKQENEHGAFVTQHEVDEYANMRLFLDDTKGVGVAVTSDGDIVSVFKNPKQKQVRRRLTKQYPCTIRPLKTLQLHLQKLWLTFARAQFPKQNHLTALTALKTLHIILK